MKIDKILKNKRRTLSFEVFPPKTSSDFEAVKEAAYKVAELKPDFMSVTYGAGGSTGGNTLAIASGIQSDCGVTAAAHLTCVGATRQSILSSLDDMKASGIENIFALRGDRPDWMEGEPFREYRYASELVGTIKEYGGFCIGGACYPEGHPDSATRQEDVENLKKKADAGCDFLTTQMFFDNNIFYDFMERVLKAGINVPVIAGIMPITRVSQLENAVKLSGCSIPSKLKKAAESFGESREAMQQAGIIYAAEQIADLYANGVKNVHVYSMNNAEAAGAVLNSVSKLID